MALEKGYFKDSGLNVTIQHLDNISDGANQNKKYWYLSAIDEKKIDFAVTDTSFLFYKFTRKPKVIASFMQYSPMAFYSRKNIGIDTIKDFEGKKIQVFSSESLSLLLKKENIQNLDFVYEKGGLNNFINGSIDITSSYVSTASFMLDSLNIEYNVFSPSHYGLDIYGDILLLLNQNLTQEMVYQFHIACIKGWEYALKNPEEAIHYIMNHYPESIIAFYNASKPLHSIYNTPESLFESFSVYEARTTTSLFSYPVIRLGDNNPARWQSIIDTYKSADMLKQNIKLNDILWDSEQIEKKALYRKVTTVAVVFISILAALILWTWSLKSQVKKGIQAIKEKDIENANFYKTIINSSPSAQIVTDENFFVQAMNSKGEQLFKSRNITPTENVFSLLHELSKVKPFIIEHFNDVKTCCDIFEKEMFFSGEQIFHLQISPYNGLFNKGYIFSLLDITDRKKLENQLLQSQKMETVGTLASGLAHDFNNVLGGILGPISILNMKMDRGDVISEQSLKTKLNTINQSANRASDMVQNLLALSRKEELQFTTVDLNTSISNVIRICKSTFMKCIEIIAHTPESQSIVRADHTQIEQVILNLCVNSAHAMTIMKKKGEKQGGILDISITKISKDKLPSNIPHDGHDDFFKITVKDNGVGINSRDISNIFNPFYTTKDKGSGTGLGLSMVYNIVNQHRGYINVESELGIGTSFHIFLHHETSTLDENPETNTIQNFEKRKGTVLLVDDEQHIRELAKEMLEICGYNVLIAKNGEEALILYKKHGEAIDFIILDLEMPQLSGNESFIELKKINPDLEIILASGLKNDPRVEELKTQGLKWFLKKPFTLKDIIDITEKVNQH